MDCERKSIIPHLGEKSIGINLLSPTHEWRLGGPAVVFIELKNTAGLPVDSTVVPVLNLTSKEGMQRAASYWSPVDIVADAPLDTVEEPRRDGAVSYKAKPLSLHLENGSNTFKVDASTRKWEQQISAKWPALPFSQIVRPGNYVVGLDLGGEAASSHCETTEVHISAQPDTSTLTEGQDNLYVSFHRGRLRPISGFAMSRTFLEP